jgi:hypothetical protein
MFPVVLPFPQAHKRANGGMFELVVEITCMFVINFKSSSALAVIDWERQM